MKPESRGKSILLVLVSGLSALLLAEITLRAMGLGYPGFHTMDPHVGIALLPGAEGWYRREGNAYVRINSQGLRDKEHSFDKPDDVYRIAVLGDSYAEALQVPMNDTFWSVMGRALGDCKALGNRTAEVINFGVSGYGTAQELLVLRHRVWDYEPDMVLLAVLTGNDIRNNLRSLQKDPMRPYMVLTDKGFIVDDSFLQSSGYRLRTSTIGQLRHRLLESSRLVQLVNELKNRIWTMMKVQKRVDASENVVGRYHERNAPGELGLDDMIYIEPRDPVWQEAWKVTEALILQMKQEIDPRAAFIVAVLSNPVQVHPSTQEREAFGSSLGVTDLFYPDRRIAQLGKDNGLKVVPLAERLAEYAEKHEIYLHGFPNTVTGEGHWNTSGHEVAGKYLAEEVCQYAGREEGVQNTGKSADGTAAGG